MGPLCKLIFPGRVDLAASLCRDLPFKNWGPACELVYLGDIALPADKPLQTRLVATEPISGCRAGPRLVCHPDGSRAH